MLPVVKNRSLLPNLLDTFFGKDFLSEFFNDNNYTVPAVNIIENNNEYRIEIAAPGLKKEDIKIDLHNDVLSITSEKKEETEQKDEKFIRREFSYSCFKRSFVLPDTVDADKITANHKDGILNIIIPKNEKAKAKEPRKIEIN